jgi:hypothetical protein
MKTVAICPACYRKEQPYCYPIITRIGRREKERCYACDWLMFDNIIYVRREVP